MHRKIQLKTLVRLCTLWKNRMMLSDWIISIKYATKEQIKKQHRKDDICIGYVGDCNSDDKVACIYINPEYHKIPGYKESWNIETVIIHELMHIHVSEAGGKIPEKIEKLPEWEPIEEFICDRTAMLIYRQHKKKI